MELLSENKMFDGWHKRYRHHSDTTNCEMTFAIYLPPKAIAGSKVPVVYWLSGLTCNDENFSHKAGAQRIASELGLALVMPDTSPRGDSVPDDPDNAYDFGQGAGFYLNATEAPWQQHYQMYDYVVYELPALIEANFPVTNKKSLAGHSMGGHGALTIGIKQCNDYQSVSAFSPIVNPINCPWGQKAFSHYLGKNQSTWRAYDTCELLKELTNEQVEALPPMLVDQGLADNFLIEQLQTDKLAIIAEEKALNIIFNSHQDYDHSYFFIASFIEQHLRFHQQYLD
ncbi:S-formylglutathione hydrolase [Colwellia sp. MEBiC06753]